MSSSKVIRKGWEGQRPFTLEPLGESLPEMPAESLFRPVALGGEEPEELDVESEEPPQPPTILEEEAQRLIREAYQEGVQEGRAQAEAELSSSCQALRQALSDTTSLRPQLLHEAEDDLLRLSVLIARKVMLREFACDPGIMAGVVQGAVELSSDAGGVVVRLNPQEYQVVAECREFQELLREHPTITLKPDPAVGRAGCLVETVRGNIDAGVDAQLDEILRRLNEEKSARREDEDD